MTALSAGFETGSNGNTLSAGDTGNASAFDSVYLPGTGTAKYDNAHAHGGTLAAKFVCADSGNPALAIWDASFGSNAADYGRLYIYATANPGTETSVCYYDSGSALFTKLGVVNITAAGKLKITDGAASVSATSTNSINLNGWTRIEWHLICNAATGSLEAKLYLSAESGTATETLNLTNINSGTAVARFLFGSNVEATWWLDDVTAKNASYPGATGGGAPVVSGTAEQTQTLTETGATTPRWQRDFYGDSTYTNIPGATSSTYVLAVDDVDCNVRCHDNTGGLNSNVIGTVYACITNTVAPLISGPAVQGTLLSVSTGTWTGGKTSYAYSYQWRRDGGTLGGATSSTYTLVAGDVTHTIDCLVTNTDALTVTASQASNSIGPVSGPTSFKPRLLIETLA